MNNHLSKILRDLNITDYNSLSEEKFNKLISIIDKDYDNQKQLLYGNFLESILDEIPCTISVVTSELKYKWVNKLLAKQIGRNKEDFIGEGLGEITKDNKFALFSQNLFKTKENRLEELIHVEIENYNKFFYVIGKKNKDNTLATIIGLDITELKKLEEENKFNSQLKTLGEVASHIVHEINNPLSAISMINEHDNYLHNDLRDVDEVEESEEAVEILDKLDGNYIKVKDTIKTISLIIEGTKEMAKKDNSNKHEDVLVSKIFNQVKIISGVKANKVGAKLQFENNCSEDATIRGNYVNLLQVFINLISNSIDAVEDLEEKWVKIKSKKSSDNKIEFEIVDSGKGIPKDIADKMFNAFYSSKPIGKGNGIGLDLCKKIVEQHKGSLSLDPSRKNTTFLLKL